MNRIQKFLAGLGQTGRALVFSVFALFAAAGIAQAATTIGTSIQTDGTLGVTLLSSLVGHASTTMLSVTGPAYFGSNAATSTFAADGSLTLSSVGTLGVTGLSTFGYASTTGSMSVAGNFMVNGNATTTSAGAMTLTGPLTVTNVGAPTATTTATVGCVVTEATSTATPIKLLFNTVAGNYASTTINGAAVGGTVLWAYGSSCAH